MRARWGDRDSPGRVHHGRLRGCPRLRRTDMRRSWYVSGLVHVGQPIRRRNCCNVLGASRVVVAAGVVADRVVLDGDLTPGSPAYRGGPTGRTSEPLPSGTASASRPASVCMVRRGGDESASGGGMVFGGCKGKRGRFGRAGARNAGLRARYRTHARPRPGSRLGAARCRGPCTASVNLKFESLLRCAVKHWAHSPVMVAA